MPLRGGRIVEHATHRGGQPRYVAVQYDTPENSFIDDRFTQTADAGTSAVPAAAASCATSPNGFRWAGTVASPCVQQRQQLGVVEASPDEPAALSTWCFRPTRSTNPLGCLRRRWSWYW